METITPQQVKEAINAFLTEQYETKTSTEQKQLIKATEEQDFEKIADLNEKISKAKQKYELETWMADAANRMAKQISFGTHISKGVHSSSKGDNVNFIPTSHLPRGFVGHQSLRDVPLDASGNAAALPVASFFDFDVDSEKQVKIKDLLASGSELIKYTLSANIETSLNYYEKFKQCLLGVEGKARNCGSNKQLLWPLEATSDSYISITPLYPITLSYYLYNLVNQSKYTRGESKKANLLHKSFANLSVVHIGGTNPQGVSRLMKKQNGRNYLLPSLPPKFQQLKQFKIPTYANSIFDKPLDYRCKDTFKALVRLVKTQYNNVNIRKARQAVLDDLLFQVLSVASSIQQQETPGWSQDYSLSYSEKLWLDPQRGAIEGEEAFKQDRASNNWQADISERFARWVNAKLRNELKHIKHDFADAEHIEWQREMDDMISQSQRAGQGVFL